MNKIVMAVVMGLALALSLILIVGQNRDGIDTTDEHSMLDRDDSISTDPTSPETRDVTLQEFIDFIHRINTYQNPVTGEIVRPDYFVNRLPESMNVVAPPNSELIGSFSQGRNRFFVVYDSNETPEDVLEFYEVNLDSEDWTSLQSFSGQGFTLSMTQDQSTFAEERVMNWSWLLDL